MNGRDISIAAIAVVLAFLGGMVVQGTAGDRPESTDDVADCMLVKDLFKESAERFREIASRAVKEAEVLQEANIRLTHRLKVVSGAPDATKWITWEVSPAEQCPEDWFAFQGKCVQLNAVPAVDPTEVHFNGIGGSFGGTADLTFGDECEDGLLVYGADCIEVVWDQGEEASDYVIHTKLREDGTERCLGIDGFEDCITPIVWEEHPAFATRSQR